MSVRWYSDGANGEHLRSTSTPMLRLWRLSLVRFAAAEASRHEGIEAVIEATTHRALYEIVDDRDFSNGPRPYRKRRPGY